MTRALVAVMFAVAASVGAQIAPQAVTPPATAIGSPTAQLTVPLPGADAVLDARTKDVASRLRCPVCQGESIQDSPAELATQMKTLVRERLDAGESEAQVLEYFTQKYGQWILLEPKAEGLNLIVYWLPVVFLLFGAAGIAVVVKRWTRPRADLAMDISAPEADRTDV